MTPTAADLLKSHAVPALHLVAASDDARFSRIGGHPNLPEGEAWPCWDGVPLAFLAQLDLGEIPAGAPRGGHPDTGCLWFFYDAEQSTWGFDPKDRGSWAVIYSPERPKTAPRPPPEDLLEDGEYTEVPVEFRAIQVTPSLERLESIAGPFDDSDDDAIDDARLEPFQGRPHHQMGGYPDVVQNDSMELECQLVTHGLYCGDSSGYQDPRSAELEQGANGWKLLLQLDTDDDAGMMWGDCGLIYFWIHEDDLAKRDFSRVWMILQCS